MNDLLGVAVQHSSVLTLYYIEHVCATETQQLIRAHRHFSGREHTVCHLTAAALAWLLTGRDIAAPFSDAWEKQSSACGRDTVVACGRSEACFEAEHVVIILDDGVIVDSHFMRQQPMAIRSRDILNEYAGFEIRAIYFDAEPAEKIQDRLGAIQL